MKIKGKRWDLQGVEYLLEISEVVNIKSEKMLTFSWLDIIPIIIYSAKKGQPILNTAIFTYLEQMYFTCPTPPPPLSLSYLFPLNLFNSSLFGFSLFSLLSLLFFKLPTSFKIKGIHKNTIIQPFPSRYGTL